MHDHGRPNLAQQTLESSGAKALKGLSLARQYLRYGFTTLRDLGTMGPNFWAALLWRMLVGRPDAAHLLDVGRRHA